MIMKKYLVISLHLIYWMIYLFILIMMIIALNMSHAHFHFRFAHFMSPISFGALIPGLLGFYAYYFLLFDKALKPKKLGHLLLGATLIAILTAAITQLCMYTLLPSSSTDWSWNTCISMGSFLTLVATIHGCIALVIRGFIQWYEDIELKSELNKKNYDTEIALLKSQINPHFLFNTINNIDSLITKDPVKASAYLNKLSDIMRFMLYETKTDLIPLSKELQYIDQFIELQKIRSSHPDYVHYKVHGDPSTKTIPPMLLISFIENAFKHAESKKSQDAISIQLDITEDKIIFTCENKFMLQDIKMNQSKGLGNELIKKRLNLLFPHKHTLNIKQNNDLYKVVLILF